MGFRSGGHRRKRSAHDLTHGFSSHRNNYNARLRKIEEDIHKLVDVFTESSPLSMDDW